MSNSMAIVCDLDGVIFSGSTTIEGAGRALDRIASAGHRVLFATNNATKTTAQVAERLTRSTGHRTAPEDVATSAVATAQHIAGVVEAAYVIGEPGLVATLQDAGVDVSATGEGVDAVVVGLDRGLTYEKLATASLAVRAGATLYATNTDATFPTPHGQVPGAGTLVAAVERASGATAVACGKPHEPMADLVRTMVGEAQVVMVGDRIETDIDFGARQGWRTVLTLTGVTAPSLAATSHADHVIGSIAELPELLASL